MLSAAVVLNNAGVSLMERNAFAEARKVLQNASVLMKAVSSSRSSSPRRRTSPDSLFSCCTTKEHTTGNIAAIEVTRMLHEASQFLVQNPLRVSDGDQSGMKFYVTSIEDHGATLLTDETSLLSPSTTYLIRIETARWVDLVNPDGNNGDDFDNAGGINIEASIILHNFSCVYKCLAIQCLTENEKQGFYTAALKLGMLSLALLAQDNKHQQHHRCCCHTSDGHMVRKESVLILQNIVSNCLFLGREDDAAEYYSEMMDFRHLLLSMGHFLLPTPPAAAA